MFVKNEKEQWKTKYLISAQLSVISKNDYMPNSLSLLFQALIT